MKYKLSVIIPMYNAEQYIARCLTSLLQLQIAEDKIEIIIIDDGSTDNSAKVVEEYCLKHANILFFQQENKGQSAARNFAVKHATGDYIWFVDADDYIETKNFMTIYHLLNEKEVDIFSMEFFYEDERHGKYVLHSLPLSKINAQISGEEAILRNYAPGSVCGFLINKSFYDAHQFSFEEGIIHEDAALCYQLLVYAEKIYFCDIPVYIYYENKNSSTHGYTKEKLYQLFIDDIAVSRIFNQLAEQCDQLGKNKLVGKTIRETARSIVFSMVLKLFRKRSLYKKFGLYHILKKELKEEKIIPLNPPYKSFKHALVGKCLNIIMSF